ncbi:MAG: hypothetical protein KC443_07935 [Anaerolineales bacterium]|nr:hypothetical protein [Anaerolineales bacterium]
MSTPVNWLKYILYLIWVALVNPFVVGVNLMLIWTQLAQDVAGSSSKLPTLYIPVWLLTGMILAALTSGAWYLLVRGRKQRLPFARFWGIDAWAHIVYAPFILFTMYLMFDEVDGGMMGFVALPTFAILTVITTPISWIILFVLRRRANAKLTPTTEFSQ